ncbi:MAG: UDP-N-acetylmuramoyl-tripeptide--D-alanyl-D-alanine ligase [Flavobacteriia bacterium]|nr:UDP-N-acetylmuramoyl-tripeptide--D-alanyl-D-alanine ligase [Flavobacteriia bacterium]
MEKLFKLFDNTNGVSIDTRTIQKDSLFIAIKGDKFDGNLYAEKAIEAGAKFAIVCNKSIANEINIFWVEDTLLFLQKLANFHRSKFNIPIIGITGSNGKTSTKELINVVLSQKYNVLCTKGNLNNHLGVPLTLLQLNESHELAIIEMGANKHGDIKELAEIAEPNYGIITNIGKAHLEGFINFEGVLKTKLELFDFISSAKGEFIVNADDEILNNATKDYSKRMLYSTNKNSEVQGRLEGLTPFVELSYNTENYESPCIKTNMIGNYNFYNFLVAITFGHLFKVSNDLINEAISNYVPSNNRSQVLKTNINELIIDCYNANPSSMLAALESFLKMKETNKIAILGDMLELGEGSNAEHHKILTYCKDHNIEYITIGPIFQSLNKDGFNSIEDYKEFHSKNKLSEKTILLKGSRGITLELLIPYL